MSDLLNQLRKAIETCGQSRYRIAKESGVDQGVLCRLMQGGYMDVRNVERVADYLGLRAELRPKATDSKRTKRSK